MDMYDAPREQVVPLYLSQDPPASAADDSTLFASPAGSRKAPDEVVPPSLLMTYPPLAYMLNALLTGLNFLREVPLVTAREAVLLELSRALVEMCSFVVGMSREIRAKGLKYISGGGGSSNNNNSSSSSSSTVGSAAAAKGAKQPSGRVARKDADAAGTGGTTGGTDQHLDFLYCRALAFDAIPHLLACFDHIFSVVPPIYPSSSSSSSSSSSMSSSKDAIARRGGSVSITVERLSDAKDRLSPASFAVLEACWTVLSPIGRLHETVSPATPSTTTTNANAVASPSASSTPNSSALLSANASSSQTSSDSSESSNKVDKNNKVD